MSVQALASVFRLGDDVRLGNRLTLLALANYANERGECWPSIERLSRDAGMHPDSTRRAIGWLIDEGYVIRVVNAAPDTRIPTSRRPNLYRLTKKVGGTKPPPQETDGVAPPSLWGRASVGSGGDEASNQTIREPSKNRGPNGSFVPGSGSVPEFAVDTDQEVNQEVNTDGLKAARSKLDRRGIL